MEETGPAVLQSVLPSRCVCYSDDLFGTGQDGKSRDSEAISQGPLGPEEHRCVRPLLRMTGRWSYRRF